MGPLACALRELPIFMEAPIERFDTGVHRHPARYKTKTIEQTF